MSSSPEFTDHAAARPLTPRQRRRALLLLLSLGVVMCFWQLGSNGLVDETPPLFAAAGRATTYAAARATEAGQASETKKKSCSCPHCATTTSTTTNASGYDTRAVHAVYDRRL